MRNILPALFVASSIAVGVAAQGPPPQAPAGPPQPAPRTEQPAPAQKPATTQAASKVTISGCIQSAPPAAAAPGAPPATPAESKFDLASAKVVSGEAVGTTGSAATATRYRLEGDEKTISTHLNHQVEVTGTVSPATAGGASASPMLKVESVKMLAAKCS